LATESLYEYGIFKQLIRDGWQAERCDEWLRLAILEVPAQNYMVGEARGRTESYRRARPLSGSLIPDRMGTPYDTPCQAITTIQSISYAWSAQASEQFNFQVFNAGDYTRAVIDKNFSENISKVLYPNDNRLQDGNSASSRSTSLLLVPCMTLSAFTCATTIIFFPEGWRPAQ